MKKLIHKKAKKKQILARSNSKTNQIPFTESVVVPKPFQLHSRHWKLKSKLYPKSKPSLNSLSSSDTALRSTIVCLHGLSAQLNCWDSMASWLNRNGFDVVAYDLRGRGKSSKPKTGYGLEAHIQDLQSILDHYQISNPVLLGHSFGCMIALRYALQNPGTVKGLVLLDGGGLLSTVQKLRILKVLKPSFDRLGKIFPSEESYLALMKHSPLIPQWTQAVEEYLKSELVSVSGGFLCHMPSFVMQEELREMGGGIDKIAVLKGFFQRPVQTVTKLIESKKLSLESIDCPSLILRATEKNLFEGDDLLPSGAYQEMLRRIPNSKGVELKTNHYGILFGEDSDRDRAIYTFLNSIAQ